MRRRAQRVAQCHVTQLAAPACVARALAATAGAVHAANARRPRAVLPNPAVLALADGLPTLAVVRAAVGACAKVASLSSPALIARAAPTEAQATLGARR